MEVNEILTAIQALSEADKSKVQEALASTQAEENTDNAQPSAPESDASAAAPVGATAADIAQDEPMGESEERAPESETELGESEEESAVGESAAPAKNANEPIPDMSKAVSPAPESVETAANPPPEQTAPPLQDEQGGEMPIDYGQIIDGLNAKNLALESENKQLKAKMEGAFGLTSKPGAFAAVNDLYGDTSDIPVMRK